MIFAQYAEEYHGMTSSQYSLTTAIGSIINIFQTGWLFNKLIQCDVSIPMISSYAGIAGGRFHSFTLSWLLLVIAMAICISSNSILMDFVGATFIMIAYGFVAPTAPTIMSVWVL